MHQAFADIAFDDPEQAGHDLDALLALASPALENMLHNTLKASSNPDRAITSLHRYLDSCLSPDMERTLMSGSPKYLHLLVTLFSQSYFLSDLIFRYPQYVSWLWSEAELKTAHSYEEMKSGLLKSLEAFDSFEDCCRAMRRFRQREILRIATRDIVEYAPLASVTEDLSNLADATLETAFHVAGRDLHERFGAPLASQGEASFVIMAMGKLGGRELNFSSDVDLLFFYSEDGETTGGSSGTITNEEYFKKLGERIIKAMSEQTAEGVIFRVDMRLRPFGRLGPLAVSVDSAIQYFTDYGRAWERQALIKARPCAGDRTLGETFLDRMRSFVFPKYFDDETLEDIREVKRQAESSLVEPGQTEREVKLGRGGIRDIEFTVQMLQLLNGGRFPELRTASTLQAIDALGELGHLGAFDAATLASNYAFLRQVEHRLQIEDGRQCHELPEDPVKLDEFARRLGYADGASFMRVYRDRTQETRTILMQFLATKGSGNLWVGDLLNPLSSGDAGLKKLEEFGFRDPQRAREELLLLATGSEVRPFTRHVHQLFSEIVPSLLEALSATALPDETLIRLSQILTRLSAPSTLYEIIKGNPPLNQFLVTLVANSEFLCSILVREPGLLDTLASPETIEEPPTRQTLEAELAWLNSAYESEAALYRLRDGVTLRVAMRELLRGITVAQVGDELTLLAEVILEEALRQAREKTERRYGHTDAPFAILGLGKLGGREMGYGSDLDLVFVYEAGAAIDSGMSPTEYFADVAAQTIKTLKESTRYGILYHIDARLRPDGNKGILAIDNHHLEDYYQNHAQVWERYALMKVRAVAGDPEFSVRMEAIAQEIAFSTPLERATLERVDMLRQKMHDQASPLDLKKREGGIAEVELIVRCWQLKYAAAYPALRRGGVFGTLDILKREGLIHPEQYDTLAEAYRVFRTILNRIRMMQGAQTSTLPDSQEARADLATRLGIKDDLLDLVNTLRARVHAIYQQTYSELLSQEAEQG
ncbi:MAG TPA: bifunctional [glutamate--ammonia ligase]-adenylyl-L-tyrosine phosphorylase/[glutamate--ammonia-ligase] adenylyltransferase [Candidatus Hydrogenedentes bacterium]|nr:bifunctional [glutamate--ammonia ligase]-adenylyl-L-tyrosine phosphorylase/[glutamate--ammonia-ligase] adenylyltransferase [Candidatus Hydrogenedentota bacterium]